MPRSKRFKLPKIRLATANLLCLSLAALVAHILFSWMGFSPADDGLVLAGSHRILQGEIPHRDFIAIRPVGSQLLHLPVLLTGGAYTLWVSRLLVWLEIAAIAWAWPGIIHRFLKIHVPRWEYQQHALIAFVLTANLFPVMPWPALDGLFLLSMGLALCLGQSRTRRMLGYALVGAAGLCEPAYLPMAPLALAVLGGWVRARYWIAAAFPWLGYTVWLLLASAVGEGYRQMTSAELVFGSGEAAGPSYLGLGLGGLVGGLAAYFGYSKLETGAFARRANAVRWAGTFGLFGLPVLAALFILAGRYEGMPTWGLLGAVVGATSAICFHERKFTWRVRIGMIAAAVALCASFSVGHGSPALATGLLASLLLGYGRIYPRDRDPSKEARSAFGPLASMAAVAVLACFIIGRYQHVYHEPSVGSINESLQGVLPRAGFIQTNRNTFDLMADLRAATERVTLEEKVDAYTLLPGLPAHWVGSVYGNPLPLDGMQERELTRPSLFHIAKNRLDANKGNIVILIQKCDVEKMALGIRPLPSGPYDGLIEHVRKSYRKLGETRYFELYR